MKTFEALLEDISITKLSWKKEINGWDIKINDRIDHDMLAKLQDRTNVPLKILRDKIYKGIEYTIKKANTGFFKDPAVTVGLYFKISKFKIVLNIFIDRKQITVTTVLSDDMKFHNLIKWELNEFKEKVFDIECKLNECKQVDGFLFEPSNDLKSIEVFCIYETYDIEVQE